MSKSKCLVINIEESMIFFTWIPGPWIQSIKWVSFRDLEKHEMISPQIKDNSFFCEHP